MGSTPSIGTTSMQSSSSSENAAANSSPNQYQYLFSNPENAVEDVAQVTSARPAGGPGAGQERLEEVPLRVAQIRGIVRGGIRHPVYLKEVFSLYDNINVKSFGSLDTGSE